MKKLLLISFFLIISAHLFSQQYSQYNTGTLYDSFENPARAAFVTDSSKQFAFNFFIPNFDANLFLSGNGQASLKNRLFNNKYDNSALLINQGKYNLANANVNAYLFMVKMFTSFNGDVEMGISAQIRGEGTGVFTDETLALFNGTNSFPNTSYTNIFNSNYYYQTYDQISFSYREKINKQLSLGFKISALSGSEYQQLNIKSSSVVFDKAADAASLALQGTYRAGFTPGQISSRDNLPTFRNPGASISLGSSYRTDDGFTIQGNVKDLGFIHWSGRSGIYNFDNTAYIRGLSKPAREDSIYNKVYTIVHSGGEAKSFNTPIDGRFEASASKSYWIDDNNQFKYSPTLIASKELFYNGFTGVLVNPFQYKSYVVTATFSYDDLKTFNAGGQFMYKTPNFEFFIGSNRLYQTASFAHEAINKGSGNTYSNSGYTGGDVFLGFSLKFGPVIEHPMNSSVIPTGEKGFLGRLWGRLFKTNNGS